jgi:hypothetical protein
MLRALFYGLPAVTFLVGLPLALKRAPPNRFYGFRTRTTFSSIEAWYQINFATGLALMAAGILGGMLVLLLGYGVIPLKPETRDLVGIIMTAALTMLLLVPVAFYANKF